jgi:glycosyltransferase involved in cell wall biosynthesis
VPDEASNAPVVALVEVGDTLRVPYVTGIQRTVREVLRHWPEEAAVQIVPVVHTGRRFRRLTPEEHVALAAEPAGPASVAPRGGWRDVARRVPGTVQLHAVAMRAKRRLAHRRWADLFVDLDEGALLFDLEATWWSPAPRPQLLPELRERGVRVATLVYDLMPLGNPEWFDPENRGVFVPWAQAQLAHAELAICFSRFCAAEVDRHGGPPTALFVPGADPSAVVASRPDALPDDGAPFALAVGTVEPRKNLRLLLDAFDRLWADGREVRLVVVGREGWHVESLVARLRAHPELGRRLIWVGWMPDAEVDWLYRNAHAVAVPSRCEGYGLPVVEGLRRGAPVISSTGGALTEVGGAAVTYAEPDDVEAWTEALGAHLAGDRPEVDPDRQPPAVTATWSEAARTIAGHLAALVGA